MCQLLGVGILTPVFLQWHYQTGVLSAKSTIQTWRRMQLQIKTNALTIQTNTLKVFQQQCPCLAFELLVFTLHILLRGSSQTSAYLQQYLHRPAHFNFHHRLGLTLIIGNTQCHIPKVQYLEWKARRNSTQQCDQPHSDSGHSGEDKGPMRIQRMMHRRASDREGGHPFQFLHDTLCRPRLLLLDGIGMEARDGNPG